MVEAQDGHRTRLRRHQLRWADQADDRDHERRPGRTQRQAHDESRPTDRLGLLHPAVSVLPKCLLLDCHGARPVLGVHDEDTRRSDNDVVDCGAPPAGPGDVVQDLEAVGAQPLQGRANELPVVLSVFQVPCGTFECKVRPRARRGHIVDIANLDLETAPEEPAGTARLMA